MALATLSIDLVAQLAQLQTGMDKAGRIADKNAAQIEARYKRMEAVAVGVGTALGSAISAAGLVQFFRATVDGLDKLNDLSDATGASVENLSALEDIAARTGTSMDTVGDAVVKLNKALGEAKPGSDVAAAFKALNLNAEELKRLDPAEALRRVAVALSGYADDGNKARLTQELFGKSLKEVAPLLKDLSEAGKLNATVTAEQARAAEDFNKQLFSLQKNVTDVGRDIGGVLIPALNDFLVYARRASDESQTLGERFSDLFKAAKSLGAGSLLGLSSTDFDVLKSVKSDLAAIEEALKRQDLSEARRAELEQKRIGRLATIAKLQSDGAASFRPSQNYGDQFKPSLPAVAGDKPGKPAAARKEDAFVFKLDDTTAAALKRLENTDAQKIASLRLELQALIEIRAETGAGSVDEAILDIEDALAKLTPEGQAAAEAVQRLNAVLAQTPTAQLQQTLKDIELINKEFEGSPERAAQWAEAILVATEGIRKGTEDTTVQISDFAQQAARNIQDALGDTLLQTMEGSTAGIEDLWKNMLKKLVAEAAAAQLGKFLLGDSFSKTGQVGGAAGDLFTFLKGLGGGARAMGGPISAGRPYLVGERGPELVVPRAAGNVVPNNALAAGGGGNSYPIYIQGDASANTVRLIRQAQAQQEARAAYRSRY